MAEFVTGSWLLFNQNMSPIRHSSCASLHSEFIPPSLCPRSSIFKCLHVRFPWAVGRSWTYFALLHSEMSKFSFSRGTFSRCTSGRRSCNVNTLESSVPSYFYVKNPICRRYPPKSRGKCPSHSHPTLAACTIQWTTWRKIKQKIYLKKPKKPKKDVLGSRTMESWWELCPGFGTDVTAGLS